jgi:hypothetical protein
MAQRMVTDILSKPVANLPSQVNTMNRYKRPFSLALLLVGLLLLSTCRSGAVSELEEAERRWQERGIDDYQIEVLVVRSIWHAQSHVITVEDGIVTEQTADCIPAPAEIDGCEVEPFAAEDFTVSGLFAKARASADQEWVEIVYDPTYGFPVSISFNNPEIVDGDWSWGVTSFEPLE